MSKAQELARAFGKRPDQFKRNWLRNVRTIAEHSKDKEMTRKVDIYEYQDLADCIRMDQVPASEIAEIFTDKSFYKWYKKKYFDNK